MTFGDVYQKAYKLRVFQIWQLTDELEKDWGFLGRSFVKERVKSWLKTQLKAGTVLKVNKEPPIFTFSEFKSDWIHFLRKKTCLICNEEFIPKNSQEKYCSEKCKSAAEYQQKKEYKKQYLKQRKDLTRKASRNYTQRLQQKTVATKKGRWTDEELKILRNAYLQKGKLSKKDLVDIAQKLERSFKSVENKYFEVKKK